VQHEHRRERLEQDALARVLRGAASPAAAPSGAGRLAGEVAGIGEMTCGALKDSEVSLRWLGTHARPREQRPPHRTDHAQLRPTLATRRHGSGPVCQSGSTGLRPGGTATPPESRPARLHAIIRLGSGTPACHARRPRRCTGCRPPCTPPRSTSRTTPARRRSRAPPAARAPGVGLDNSKALACRGRLAPRSPGLQNGPSSLNPLPPLPYQRSLKSGGRRLLVTGRMPRLSAASAAGGRSPSRGSQGPLATPLRACPVAACPGCAAAAGSSGAAARVQAVRQALTLPYPPGRAR